MHVAGKLGGVLPNPGLIEGLAVATSPDDDELTDEQWARAMMDLKIDPSGWLALEPLGIACLARQRGIPVDVESDYIPAWLVRRDW